VRVDTDGVDVEDVAGAVLAAFACAAESGKPV
jgi:hypothetical protein